MRVTSATIALALTATLPAAPASAAPPARSKFEPLVMNNWQLQPKGCSLTAYFASIGIGIGHQTRSRIEEALERDSAVIKVRPYLRGREGDTLLCIETRKGADVGRLFRRLRALVPPGTRGRPITIEAKGDLRFSRY